MPTPADTPLLLDAMLGKLSTYLRMCGYDAAYALDRGIEADPRLRDLARREGRTLVTRDVELGRTTDGSLVLRTRDIEDQLVELLEAGFELELSEPARCSVCNGRLRRSEAGEKTPPFAPSLTDQPVWRCRGCGQPFWCGSHWRDVETTLETVRSRASETYRRD